MNTEQKLMRLNVLASTRVRLMIALENIRFVRFAIPMQTGQNSSDFLAMKSRLNDWIERIEVEMDSIERGIEESRE